MYGINWPARWVAFGVLLGLSTTTFAKDNTYAALAYSLTNHAYAVGQSSAGLKDAYNRATDRCTSADCFVRVGVINGCVAFASDAYGRGLGFGKGTDRKKAEASAMFYCERPWKQSCERVFSFCSDEPMPELDPMDLYAAIAWSKSTVRVGKSNNDLSRADARDNALRDCGEKDCVVMAMTNGGCVAYANSAPDANRRQWFGFSNGQTKTEAEKLALGICDYNKKDWCQVADSFCVNPGEPAPSDTAARTFAQRLEDTGEAFAILRMCNHLTVSYLAQKSGISAKAKAGMARHTGAFGTLDELVDLGCSKSDLGKLRGLAIQMGYMR